MFVGHYGAAACRRIKSSTPVASHPSGRAGGLPGEEESLSERVLGAPAGRNRQQRGGPGFASPAPSPGQIRRSSREDRPGEVASLESSRRSRRDLEER
jgi:hypothetical protein